MTTVPATVPKVPPFTVTVLTPLTLVTVTVTVAGAEVVPVPRSKVEVVVKVLVPPWATVSSPVSASNAQGVTVIVVGATMPGMVEAVMLKMHEPKLNVPVAVPVPAAIEKSGVVAPAGGAVNLTVVAVVVPNAGTPAGKLKPVDTAVKAAVAVVAVAGAIVTAAMSSTAMVAAGVASSSPPQAASVAARVRPKANLASVTPEAENLSMVISLLMKNTLTNVSILEGPVAWFGWVCFLHDKVSPIFS